MFKKEVPTTKGEQTRLLIFNTALELFRENGFDATTMQEVAARAGIAKSAAYYYFPSKEAIIQAYYETIENQQEQLCADFFAQTSDLKKRLHTAMLSKFSCLGKGTEDIRRRATILFEQAASVEKLPKDLQLLLPLALWSLQMGLLVMFLYDNSPNQKRTRALATGSIDFTLKMLTLAKLAVFKPIRARIMLLLTEAQLLPTLH